MINKIIQYISIFFSGLKNKIKDAKSDFNPRLFFRNLVNFIKKPSIPWTLYKMLLKEFFNWFVVAQSLFIIILLIVDLFAKLNDYTNNSVPILSLLQITALYIPKAISLTIPVTIMFGITMTLGTYYQNNELVAIYTIGVSLIKFALPVVFFNIFLSFALIFLDSTVVITTERYRLDLFESVTKKNASGKFDNENITIRGEENYFWNVERFFSAKNILQNVIVFRINKNYQVNYRLDALKGVYTDKGWLFYSGVIREWDESGDMKEEIKFQKKAVNFKEKPSIFKKSRFEIENMTIEEAQDRIKLLKKLNIEYSKELTGYYKKFSFPFTLLIVALFAIGVATVSRTNVLILSLFFSVGLAVLYYVAQIILDVLASTGKIPPLVGAWLTFFIFLPIAFYLIGKAKT